MKRLKIATATLLVSALTVGCSDGFFDLTPNDKVTTKNMYTSASDFNLAVIGCYAKLQTQPTFCTECCEFRSDNLYLNAPTAGTQDRYDIDQFKDKPSNGILTDYWANFNNGVYRCNMILDRIDEVPFDEQLKKQYKGEAMFIRAFTYFNMYRTWGRIPITRTVLTADQAIRVGRASEQEIQDLLINDLKYIVENNLLPDSYTGNNVGRITVGAAQALLGKVYLTFHRWVEARDILAQVVGKYELVDINDIFSVEKKMNREIIFAIRYNKDIVGEGHGFWYSIVNLTDNTNQTQKLLDCYSDPKDKRKELITYVKVAGESSVCVMNKFYDTRNTSTKNVGNDQIVLRHADVLLMYAEALNEIAYSNDQNSLQMKALNQVHQRAGLDPIAISTLPNQDSFRDALLLERQREFPYEGHRWFDLVRMRSAVREMRTDGHSISENQFLFPVPQTEVELYNDLALFGQNPGY